MWEWLKRLFATGDERSDTAMIMDLADMDKYCPRGLNVSDATSSLFKLSPFNDSCLQNFFEQLQHSLRRYSEWEEVLYTVIYVVISVAALIGNGLVILAVVRKKAMRTNRNVLILNLALSNLMLAITNIPFLWLPSIDFEFPYSRFFCKFANALPGSNIYCSTFSISVMAIDRYYSVKRLSVSSPRSQCARATAVALLIWVLSFVLNLPLLVYYDTTMLYVFKDVNVLDASNRVIVRSYGWRQCRLSLSSSEEGDNVMEKNIQLLMSVMQVLFLYVVPLVVLSIFNVKLTRFLKSNASQLNRNRADSRKVGSKKECSRASSIRSPSVPSIRSTAVERASERRTSRTTALLVAMAGSYAALWLPFTLVSLLLDLDILYSESQVALIERIDQCCKVISMLSICVNPFLYGFLNTNFRNEFVEIYRTWVLCQGKRHYAMPRTEYSSVAYPVRNNSISEEGMLHTISRSIRGSMQRMRVSLRRDANSTYSSKACSARSSIRALQPVCDDGRLSATLLSVNDHSISAV